MRVFCQPALVLAPHIAGIGGLIAPVPIEEQQPEGADHAGVDLGHMPDGRDDRPDPNQTPALPEPPDGDTG